MSERVKVKMGRLGQALGFSESTLTQRRDLNDLIGDVSAYQPSEAAQKLTDTLNEALRKLDGGGKKKARIEEADKVCKSVREELKKLAKQKEETEKQRKSEQPNKKQLKAMKTLQQELEKELDDALGTMATGLGDIHLVEVKDSKQSLLGTADTVRRMIFAGDPNEGDRADDIRDEIGELKLRIDKASLAHQKEAAFMGTLAVQHLSYAEEVLKRFDDEIKGSYQGPLLETVKTMRMSMTAKPADPATIRLLFDQVLEVTKSAKSDKSFVKDSHGAAVEQKNGQDLLKRIEPLFKPLHDDLEFLRNAEAPGYGDLSRQEDKIRKTAGQPIASDKVHDAFQTIGKDINDFGLAIDQERKSLEQGIAQAGKAAQDALAKAKKLLGEQQKIHGEASVVSSDFKAAIAQLGGAERILPAAGKLPPNLTIKDAKLAQSLAEQAAKSLGDIASNETALRSFDEDTKKLKGELEGRTFFEKIRGKGREMLEKYNPALREELEGKLKDLLDELPTTSAKTALETFNAIKKEAKDALDALDAPSKLIEGDADRLSKQMRGLRIGWIMGSNGPGSGAVTKGPRAFDAALDALEAQMKLQPPVESAVKAAMKTAQDELDKAQKLSTNDLAKLVDGEMKEDEKTKVENEKKRSAETKRLAKLELKYEAAKNAVGKVDGDKNSLATAKRMIDQIKSSIEANAFDRLESKRNDLDGRLTLLLSNPHGEVNRHRSELPSVINELRGSIRAAVSNLGKVAEEIGKHDAATDDEKSAQAMAGKLFKAYTDLLESEVDDLANAAKPITSTKVASEDERRKAREEGLRILRSFRKRVQVQPMTSELLTSPFPEAKGSIAPIFRSLDKYEYTLTTCI